MNGSLIDAHENDTVNFSLLFNEWTNILVWFTLFVVHKQNNLKCFMIKQKAIIVEYCNVATNNIMQSTGLRSIFV